MMYAPVFKTKAYLVYLWMVGTNALASTLMFTLNLVYQFQVARLNPLQLILVGTVLEIVSFCSQIPTGVIADVYSRRLALTPGYFLMGCGFVIVGAFARFDAILIGNALWGIGATCVDGAQEAWITDEIGDRDINTVFTRGSQITQIAGLVGIACSVILGSIALRFPILAGAFLLILLSLLLPLITPEEHFQPVGRAERNSWQSIQRQFLAAGQAIRLNPLLISLFGESLCLGLASEGFDRLNQAYFLQNFSFPSFWALTPVIWFGIMSAASSLLSIAVSEIVNRRINMQKMRAIILTLLAIDLVLMVGIVIFALAGNFFLALLTFCLVSVARTARRPIYRTWTTHSTDSRVRATIFSVAAMVDSGGQIAGGPVVGSIGQRYSIRSALVVTGLLLSPVLPFALRALRVVRKDKRELPLENSSPDR
ncbi:MAG TPA: MFS transporter [Ktedonobacteraceae bacterium]|jgi:DHA3 family tetracycline resistance protein-like MFS transporter